MSSNNQTNIQTIENHYDANGVAQPELTPDDKYNMIIETVITLLTSMPKQSPLFNRAIRGMLDGLDIGESAGIILHDTDYKKKLEDYISHLLIEMIHRDASRKIQEKKAEEEKKAVQRNTSARPGQAVPIARAKSASPPIVRPGTATYANVLPADPMANTLEIQPTTDEAEYVELPSAVKLAGEVPDLVQNTIRFEPEVFNRAITPVQKDGKWVGKIVGEADGNTSASAPYVFTNGKTTFPKKSDTFSRTWVMWALNRNGEPFVIPGIYYGLTTSNEQLTSGWNRLSVSAANELEFVEGDEPMTNYPLWFASPVKAYKDQALHLLCLETGTWTHYEYTADGLLQLLDNAEVIETVTPKPKTNRAPYHSRIGSSPMTGKNSSPRAASPPTEDLTKQIAMLTKQVHELTKVSKPIKKAVQFDPKQAALDVHRELIEAAEREVDPVEVNEFEPVKPRKQRKLRANADAKQTDDNADDATEHKTEPINDQANANDEQADDEAEHKIEQPQNWAEVPAEVPAQ